MVEPGELPDRLGILPFANKVLFPGAIAKIQCISSASVKLIEEELWQKEERGLIGVIPVRVADATEISVNGSMLSPGQYEILDSFKLAEESIQWHGRGVAARVLDLSRGVEKPSGKITYNMILEGLCRFNVHELSTGGAYRVARVEYCDTTKSEMEQAAQDPDLIMLSRQFKVTATRLIAILEKTQKPAGRSSKILLETLPVHRLADIFVASFEISFEEQLSMLDTMDLKKRLIRATQLAGRHFQLIHVAEQITQKVEKQLSRSQKEFLLREQIKAINDELVDGEEDLDDMATLEKKMRSAGMPPDILKYAHRELRRLRQMRPHQPGYGGSRVYLELLSDLPWRKATQEQDLDLKTVKERLDNKHYGLDKVKQRIVEYLAVRKLKCDAGGSVLCLVGPPGVGKTSLASSIASALNRKFIRISLGGVRDEADIRGHRRTYIGSMPGRLIDGLKRAGVSNPVMLLDEIDKTTSGVCGDPASALLEVLDPGQNKTFTDHYLNVPFDLSKVFFIATANYEENIPLPLLDRMEVIELSGYTLEEKLKIGARHLIPRVLHDHGLKSDALIIPEATVKLIIQNYTREAGIRNLERYFAALARSVAVKHAEQILIVQSGDVGLARIDGMQMGVSPTNEKEIPIAARGASSFFVDDTVLEKVLGPPLFIAGETSECVASPGIAMDLVWTSSGGEVQFVEATTVAGNGDLHLTGQLGDVIKDSAQIALTWVRAKAADLKLVNHVGTNLLENRDLHIHFSSSGTPKDGSSAGVTLVTSLVSLFSLKTVRSDTAMTGEMTLTGLILPVDGIKNKVMGAYYHGIKRVIIPEQNLKDLSEVPADVLSHMEILPAKRMEDVLEHAFEDGCPWARCSKL